MVKCHVTYVDVLGSDFLNGLGLYGLDESVNGVRYVLVYSVVRQVMV